LDIPLHTQEHWSKHGSVHCESQSCGPTGRAADKACYRTCTVCTSLGPWHHSTGGQGKQLTHIPALMTLEDSHRNARMQQCCQQLCIIHGYSLAGAARTRVLQFHVATSTLSQVQRQVLVSIFDVDSAWLLREGRLVVSDQIAIGRRELVAVDGVGPGVAHCANGPATDNCRQCGGCRSALFSGAT
jgi:hypothetical protein